MKHKIKFDTLLEVKHLLEGDEAAKEFNCEFKVEQVVGPGGGNPEVSFSGEALNVYNAFVKYYGCGRFTINDDGVESDHGTGVAEVMHCEMEDDGNTEDNNGKLWFAELPLSLKKKWIKNYNDEFRYDEITLSKYDSKADKELDKALDENPGQL